MQNQISEHQLHKVQLFLFKVETNSKFGFCIINQIFRVNQEFIKDFNLIIYHELDSSHL